MIIFKKSIQEKLKNIFLMVKTQVEINSSPLFFTFLHEVDDVMFHFDPCKIISIHIMITFNTSTASPKFW